MEAGGGCSRAARWRRRPSRAGPPAGQSVDSALSNGHGDDTRAGGGAFPVRGRRASVKLLNGIPHCRLRRALCGVCGLGAGPDQSCPDPVKKKAQSTSPAASKNGSFVGKKGK